VKLHGLVITGTLLLILGGVGGWWILGQQIDTRIPYHTQVSPKDPQFIESIDFTNSIDSKSIDSINTKNSNIWVVWYGDDTAVYRLQVDAIKYKDLYSTLRQTLVQDQIRLESIASSHISATLAPIFARLPSRITPFLDNLFSITNNAILIQVAIGFALEAVQKHTSENITQVRETTRILLANKIVKEFRESVLLPGFTLRALRSASSRSFALLRQDLLENCDRYDRAFRNFVLNASGTVESREEKLGWKPDPSWQQGNATFLSLCPELRRPNIGQISDTPLIEAFAAIEKMIHAQALELVRPLADAAVDIAIQSNNTTNTLITYGLPSGISRFLGSTLNSIAFTWTIVKKAFDNLGGSQSRKRFASGILASLNGLKTDSVQRLHSVYRTFISAKIERIGLNLAARSEGVWSRNP